MLGRMGARGGFGRAGLVGGATGASFPLHGAIIDEIFTTGQYFPRAIASELVDTRASTKYVTSTSGLLSSVAANTLPISNAGMLVEPAATNISLWSQDFTNAAWTKFTNGTGSISVTAAAGIAPDGTNTANLVQFSRGAATEAARVNNTFTGTAAPYTGSLYVKANSAGDIGKVIDIVFFNGASVLTPTHVTLTANWQRVSRTDTLAASASCQLIFGYLETAFGGAGQTGITNVLVWQADTIQASAVSSPILTTTASASRSADSIVVQRTGIGSVVFTFDDASQQTISGINTATQYTVPTNLNRPLVTRMTGYSGGTYVPTYYFLGF